jgi:hypothetical protein
MPRKKSDSAVLAEIREVIADMNRGFEVRSFSNHDLVKVGDRDKLSPDLAVEVIGDVLNGKSGRLTQDYRRTKREAAANPI